MLFIFICMFHTAVITLPYPEYIWLLFLNTCMLSTSTPHRSRHPREQRVWATAGRVRACASAHSRIALPFTTGFFGVIEGAHANTANAAGRTAHPDGWPPSRVEITVGSVCQVSVCVFFCRRDVRHLLYCVCVFFKLHYAFVYLYI